MVVATQSNVFCWRHTSADSEIHAGRGWENDSVMSDRKLTPNFRRRNFAATSLSLQSTGTEEDGEDRDPLFLSNYERVAIRMQSSFDSPFRDSGSRELLQEDELAASRMMSVDEPDEEEEALDNFEMDTPNESRNDLEILSPIKLSMLSTQLLSTTKNGNSRSTSAKSGIERDGNGGDSAVTMGNNVLSSSLKGGGGTGGGDGGGGRRLNDSSVVGRPRKVVEFANFEDNECSLAKEKRTDSTGATSDAAIQAKIFAEIKK